MSDRSQPSTASEWLVALLDAPEDTGLRARAARWLEADPAHARDWEEMTRTYALLGETIPLHWTEWHASVRDGLGPRPLPDLTETPTLKRRYRGRFLGLAGLALAACLSGVLLPGVITRLGADYTTGTGEAETITLSDGSRVRLAPKSALSIAYSDDERRVRLIEGQAFFDVTPNLARPFRVETEGVETSVLGTAFEVRLEKEATDVAVRSGRVEVRNGAVTEILNAGDWTHQSRSGSHERGRIAPVDVAAWQDGYLIAKDRPVGEVVDQLRSYYSGIILLRGDRLAAETLTGVYKLSDPVGVLKAVAATQGADLLQLSPWVIVLSDPKG